MSKSIWKIWILMEEQYISITYNLKNDIRYKEGLEVGKVKAASITKTFILNLMKRTELSDRKIASLANVPRDFVRKVKEENL
jgi:hypothetical protein